MSAEEELIDAELEEGESDLNLTDVESDPSTSSVSSSSESSNEYDSDRTETDNEEEGNTPKKEDSTLKEEVIQLLEEHREITDPQQRRNFVARKCRELARTKQQLADYRGILCDLKMRAGEREDDYEDAAERDEEANTPEKEREMEWQMHLASIAEAKEYLQNHPKKLQMCQEIVRNPDKSWRERVAKLNARHERRKKSLAVRSKRADDAIAAVTNFPSKEELEIQAADLESLLTAIAEDKKAIKEVNIPIIDVEFITQQKDTWRKRTRGASKLNSPSFCWLRRTISLNRWRDKKRKRQETSNK